MGRKVGPVGQFETADGVEVPFYAITYDKRGACTSPRSLGHLLEVLEAGDHTDVFLFCHGWNNTPKEAVARYEQWVAGYQGMLAAGGYGLDRPYRPLLVGVVWPSTWIVPPWDRGPRPAAPGLDADIDEEALQELAGFVPEDGVERFYELVDTPELGEAEGRELIGLLGRFFHDDDDEIGAEAGVDVDALVAGWKEIGAAAAPTEFVPDDPGAPVAAGDAAAAGDAQAAGRVGRAPVDLIRLGSVRTMKDRAGTVGAAGVKDLLLGVLAATGARDGREAARVHLAGHSYGNKVLLSALCRPREDELPRPVDSLLMLQPAINHLAFSASLPGVGKPGGYRDALRRVRLPIMSTFTKDDFALRKAFHLALNRDRDLGEVQPAADAPPSRFAALGGYGPYGLAEGETLDARDPGEAYPLAGAAAEVLGLRAHGKIGDHGDIGNDTAYWALYSLVSAS